jgi:hypothetical protein
MTHWQVRLADKIPPCLLESSERFLLAGAWSLIGIDSTFFGAKASGVAGAPHIVQMEIGICLLIGGVSTLLGLGAKQVWLERLGQGFITLGCVIVVYAGITLFEEGGGPLVFLYTGVAITYALRLLDTTVRRMRAEDELRRDQ